MRADIPTVTVEPGYLTNPREAGLLSHGDFRDAIAMGVYQGMLIADPQIEQVKQQIVHAEAAAAAQQQAEVASAADAARTATASRWGLILGAIVVLWFVMRLAIRRQVGAPQLPQYRRRSYRRRRATSRRY